jgi:hypothetical protein
VCANTRMWYQHQFLAASWYEHCNYLYGKPWCFGKFYFMNLKSPCQCICFVVALYNNCYITWIGIVSSYATHVATTWIGQVLMLNPVLNISIQKISNWLAQVSYPIHKMFHLDHGNIYGKQCSYKRFLLHLLHRNAYGTFILCNFCDVPTSWLYCHMGSTL